VLLKQANFGFGTLVTVWLTESFFSPANGKILPGAMVNEAFIAAPSARIAPLKPLTHHHFRQWHGFRYVLGGRWLGRADAH
jgi:hypothetical protein